MLNTLKTCLPSTASDVSGIRTSMITVCVRRKRLRREGEDEGGMHGEGAMVVTVCRLPLSLF